MNKYELKYNYNQDGEIWMSLTVRWYINARWHINAYLNGPPPGIRLITIKSL